MNGVNPLEQSLSVAKFPELLVVHLKRFSHTTWVCSPNDTTHGTMLRRPHSPSPHIMAHSR